MTHTTGHYLISLPAGPHERWPRKHRTPGSGLVTTATVLLGLLGLGLFTVSLAAQYAYVFHERHQSGVSLIEAAALDLGMTIFSLMALGLARAGKSARVERVLILACAGGSAVMNYAAANILSPRSVLAFVMPPIFLAVVVDRVVAGVRRHVLGDNEVSPWAIFGRVFLYLVRFFLAPKSTALGLRRWLLILTPLPAAKIPREKIAAGKTAQVMQITGARRGPRAESKTSRFLALVAERHGPLSGFPLADVSKTTAQLAPEVGLDLGAGRTALRSAVLATRNGGGDAA
jgi:hypothetical protein